MKPPPIPEDQVSFNMAPMIDMVFQLLIFFMIASHFSTLQSVELEIPTAVHAVVPRERPDRLVINIRRDGSMSSGGQEVPDLDELKALVQSYQEVVPNLKIYLRADRDTPHLYVRKVMNAMGELGIDDFIFGAFKPSEGQTVSP